MNENYCYRVSAVDFWQLAMCDMYCSLAGMCNLVFTAAMVALAVSKWQSVNASLKSLMFLGCIWFPLIQPFLVYQRMKKKAAEIKTDSCLSFCEAGVQIDIGDESTQVKWEQIRAVSKKPTAILLLLNNRQGYLLPNRILGKRKEDLFLYIKTRLDAE